MIFLMESSLILHSVWAETPMAISRRSRVFVFFIFKNLEPHPSPPQRGGNRDGMLLMDSFLLFNCYDDLRSRFGTRMTLIGRIFTDFLLVYNSLFCHRLLRLFKSQIFLPQIKLIHTDFFSSLRELCAFLVSFVFKFFLTLILRFFLLFNG